MKTAAGQMDVSPVRGTIVGENAMVHRKGSAVHLDRRLIRQWAPKTAHHQALKLYIAALTPDANGSRIDQRKAFQLKATVTNPQ